MDMQVVTAVEPKKNYRAKLTFADGYGAESDLRPALQGPAFQPLLDKSDFRQMRVEYDTIAGRMAPTSRRKHCAIGANLVVSRVRKKATNILLHDRK